MASNDIVTTSIVVNFDVDDGASDIFKVELDDRPLPEGKNGEKSTFSPGTSVFLLLFQSSKVTHDTSAGLPFTTAGTLSPGGTTSKTFSGTTAEYLQFTGDGNKATPSYPIDLDSTVNLQWMGVTQPANLELDATSDITVQAGTDSTVDVIGIARIEYTSKATLYELANATITDPTTLEPATKYEVLAFFKGSVDE